MISLNNLATRSGVTLVEKKKKRVLGFKFLGFLGDGFGVKEKKKRQARADCVRPSRAPTSLIYKVTCCICASRS
jgi:hypothetical protein